MKLLKSLLLVLAVLAGGLLVAAVIGCTIGGPGNQKTTGSVLLQVNPRYAQSILPPVDLTCAEYIIRGTGPGGAVIGPLTITGNTIIPDLVPGGWNFTATGQNAGHIAIGEGAGGVTVVIGQTNACNITVAEYSSPDGSFLADLAWEPDIVNDPIWTGTLKDFAGTTTNQAFTINEELCTAQSLTDPLHVGWFTWIVRLWDAPNGMNGSEVLSTGAAAAVRIAAGYQTHADLFLHAVQGYGQVNIMITPDFNDELVLTPNRPFGAVSVLGQPLDFSVSADETCTSIYYLRGTQVGIDTYTIDPDNLFIGETYRLDVVSFNVAGDRAASGTWVLTRQGTVEEQFNVAGVWTSDVNTQILIGMQVLDSDLNVLYVDVQNLNAVAGNAYPFQVSAIPAGVYKVRFVASVTNDIAWKSGLWYVYFGPDGSILPQGLNPVETVAIPHDLGVTFNPPGLSSMWVYP